MFLGDFHAGCAYLSRADKKKISLFTNSKFSWLIGDKVDTTLSDETSCAYDRCVIRGSPPDRSPYISIIQPRPKLVSKLSVLLVRNENVSPNHI